MSALRRTLPGMRAEQLIARLRDLDAEAEVPAAQARGWSGLASWQARVRACVVAGLSEGHNLVSKLDANKYSPIMTVNGGTTEQWNRAYTSGVARAKAYIEAAIYELEVRVGDDDLVDESSYDPALWAHVRGLVQDEDWGKVASQAAIFVEDRLRRWAGLDGNTYGIKLYAQVLAPDGDLRLGSRAGEYEGWRNLGTGFALAIGNVERHNLHERPDARRYAIGVLGLASLMLTQVRYQHRELTSEEDGNGVTP